MIVIFSSMQQPYGRVVYHNENQTVKPLKIEIFDQKIDLDVIDIIAEPMYKLVILIEPQAESARFDGNWPRFLAEAEQMPGLRREVTSRVDRVVHGKFGVHIMHELYFDSLSAAAEAMGSLHGERAGQILQEITGGKVTLLLADHLQDELGHIKRHAQTAPPTDRA